MSARPAEPHAEDSVCLDCGGAVYRTLLETNGPTRTYWRHDANGYNACPTTTEETTRDHDHR